MIQAMLCVLPLVLGGDDLQKDYQALVKLGTEAEETMAKLRAMPRAEAQGHLSEYRALRTRLTEAIDAFAEQHLGGALNDELAGVLVDSAAHPMLRGLLRTWAGKALEGGQPKKFLASFDKLRDAGLHGAALTSLDRARAVAMFQSGDLAAARKFALDVAEEQGSRGIGLLDIAAATYCAKGDFKRASALYADFKAKHGDERSARYLDPKIELLGKSAPAIAAGAWLGAGGEKIDGWKGLEELRGKVVVLDFWQTWCPPCRAVMPGLSKLQEKMSGKAFQILGMCRMDGRPGFDWAEQKSVPAGEIKGASYVPHVQKFMKDMGLAYAVGVAEDRANSEAYKVSGIPTLVIIAPDGRVAWMTVGAGLGVDQIIESLAKRLLGAAR